MSVLATLVRHLAKPISKFLLRCFLGETSVDLGSSLLSILPAEQLSAEELVSEKQSKALFARALSEFASSLNKKEALIFERRMLSEEKATLQELAEQLSLSRERVRQIESRIKDRLKEFLLEKFGSLEQMRG